MIIVINNSDNKAGQALVEYFGGDRVSGIPQGRRSDLKNTLGNLVVGGCAGNAREEGVIALDASLATAGQADNIYIANIMARGKRGVEVFLRWYVLLHTMLPNRSIGRLVEQHNDVVPERYHVKAKLTERGYIELHHAEPLLRGYIDGDPCNVGRTTLVTHIDPLDYVDGDVRLYNIMDAYERLSPDWGGHREYETYLWDSQARELAHWPENYWYAEVLTPQHYKDLFDAYWRDSVQRRLTVKYGRKVKPLTYRR